MAGLFELFPNWEKILAQTIFSSKSWILVSSLFRSCSLQEAYSHTCIEKAINMFLGRQNLQSNGMAISWRKFKYSCLQAVQTLGYPTYRHGSIQSFQWFGNDRFIIFSTENVISSTMGILSTRNVEFHVDKKRERETFLFVAHKFPRPRLRFRYRLYVTCSWR